MEEILSELKALNAKVERIAEYLQPQSTPETTFRLSPNVSPELLQSEIEKHLPGKQQ